MANESFMLAGSRKKGPSWMDRAMKRFAPRRYTEGMVAEYIEQVIFRSGAYRGSRKSRLEEEWFPPAGSADEDIYGELDTLRARSRDLCRNNPIASSILNSFEVNIVGEGIRPQPRLKTLDFLSEQQRRDLSSKITAEWNEWTSKADSTEIGDYYELQTLALRQWLENGEAIFVRRPYDGNALNGGFVTQWQCIESDHVSTPSNRMTDKNIKNGVEIDARGRIIAYWISDEHPGEKKTISEKGYTRVPAWDEETNLRNIIHVFERRRAGQHRGVPILTPAIMFLKDLDRYLEAELVGALVSACFAVFIRTAYPSRAATARAYETSGSDRLERVVPAMIEHLGPGEEVQTFEPRKSTSFPDYTNFFTRAIGAGSNLSYERAIRDYSQTNYSSSRAASLEDYKGFRAKQRRINMAMNRPVYETFIRELASKDNTKGYFKKYDLYQHEYSRATWIGPGYQNVDPVKETESALLKIQNNLSTIAHEAAQQGFDWEEIVEQRKLEVQVLKDAGLSPDIRVKGSQGGFADDIEAILVRLLEERR